MAKERAFGPHQLAEWLGIEPRHVRRAETRGLIPPPDVGDERWSEGVAKTLPDRVEEILSVVGDENYAKASDGGKAGAGRRKAVMGDALGPHQLASELELQRWQVGRAGQLGMIPPPDVDGKRWSREVVDGLRGEAERIRETLGDHPGLGSIDAAKRLAERTELEVEREDVRVLAEEGPLRPVGEFRGYPMFSLESLDGLDRERVAAVVGERQRWIERSVTAKEAAALLGWSAGKFEVTAERHGLVPGRLGRYDRAEVEGLPGREG
ncbi:hypothetical protein CP973_04655 [Streptomyces albofaciens JCM 4342]|uniref:hypothetical protein n=1 Tax=Streptomyces albofaciens TaxID=66866 RepID=UPI0012384F97|nr:hypothetical protein [Streptomyces albofaciens]KAA6221353.1 hypothetical protein CP973_04655 [Streptomyces albofaciens JCM 4342]